MCPLSSGTIKSHQKLLEKPAFRQLLFKQYAPAFMFHRHENNFPAHPEHVIRNIIEVKRDEYLHIQERHKRGLTAVEQAELDAINKFFWLNDQFNTNYKTHQNDPDFIKLTTRTGNAIPGFLIFDEKHYGYKIGEKINVIGVAPAGHKHYDRSKNQAPITASIIPTRDGFFIQYQYLYPLSNAIVGTLWLRKILPEWLCNKVDDFAFHYGDAEGVGLHIKVDENGNTSFQSMQTWAHGKDYAQNLTAAECTFDPAGNVCVYVGLQTHPSYGDNYIGINAAFDWVGDAYKIIPDTFIDVSEDVINLALDLTQSEANSQGLAEQFPSLVPTARVLPGSLSGFKQFAASNPLAFHGVSNQTELDALDATHNNYHPLRLLTTLWRFILSFFVTPVDTSMFVRKTDFNLTVFVASEDMDDVKVEAPVHTPRIFSEPPMLDNATVDHLNNYTIT